MKLFSSLQVYTDSQLFHTCMDGLNIINVAPTKIDVTGITKDGNYVNHLSKSVGKLLVYAP